MEFIRLFPPRFLIARIWGDIMICTAENLPGKITNNAQVFTIRIMP